MGHFRDFGTYLLTMSNEYGTYVAEYDLRAEGMYCCQYMYIFNTFSWSSPYWTLNSTFSTRIMFQSFSNSGSPQTPTNTYFSDVTSTSVRLHWTSGYDMGSPQHFEMTRFNGRNAFVTVSQYKTDKWEDLLRLAVSFNLCFNVYMVRKL